MTRLRDITGLLFTLYVVAYIGVIVPIHVAAFDCHGSGDHAAEEFHHASEEQAPVSRNSHDHHRCQICLSGGLHAALPDAALILTIDLNAIDRIDDGAMSETGVTLSHCRLSRAPPTLA